MSGETWTGIRTAARYAQNVAADRHGATLENKYPLASRCALFCRLCQCASSQNGSHVNRRAGTGKGDHRSSGETATPILKPFLVIAAYGSFHRETHTPCADVFTSVQYKHRSFPLYLHLSRSLCIFLARPLARFICDYPTRSLFLPLSLSFRLSPSVSVCPVL